MVFEYGTDYDMGETAKYHGKGNHIYVLCRSVMDADVLIILPKMKTHKRTGVTLSIKNMVGANGYRNCLPHYTIGTPAESGDEFSDSNLKNKVQSREIVGIKKYLTSLGGCRGNIVYKSNVRQWDAPFAVLEAGERLGFHPHFGWMGHIEHGRAERKLEGKCGL